MSIKESFQNFFKSKEVKEAEKATEFNNALRRGRQATADYLSEQISHKQYNQIFDETNPIKQMDLRQLASELKRSS